MVEQDLGLETLKELGWGGQGLVLLCREPVSGNRVACKMLASHRERQLKITKQMKKSRKTSPAPLVHKLRGAEAYQNANLVREADLLHQLRGAAGILPLVAKVEGDDGCIHLFTPFCDGGDLLNRLEASPILREREAAHIVASLAQALVSCHARGIVHRDIKPGNVLFRRYSTGSVAATSQLHKHDTTTTFAYNDLHQVFLADFGHAASIQHPWERLDDPHVGTPPFHAPEIIRRCYDHRVDIWSVGVLMHLMLTGTMPFIQHLADDAPHADIHAAILSNKLSLNGSLLSASAQDLLKGMLCKDPEHRFTLQQVIHHPWVVLNLCASRKSNQGILNQDHIADHVDDKSARQNANIASCPSLCSTSAQSVHVLPKIKVERKPVMSSAMNENNKPAASKEKIILSSSKKLGSVPAANSIVASGHIIMNTMTGTRSSTLHANKVADDSDDEFPRFARVKRRRVDQIPSAASHQQQWRVVKSLHQTPIASTARRTCGGVALPVMIC
ncbi:hypothetical protein L7F22_040544 [Adiantum nelumboides]|nr:hypothetical protein [Adiantum nelumboides]